jgi:hypothetical protein
MLTIQRPPIQAHILPVATLFLILLRAVVALLAQRLELTCQQQIHKAVVRHNVVCHSGWYGNALFLAPDTQRIVKQVKLAPTPVTRVAVMLVVLERGHHKPSKGSSGDASPEQRGGQGFQALH